MMILPEEWLEVSHSMHSQDVSPAPPVWNAAATTANAWLFPQDCFPCSAFDPIQYMLSRKPCEVLI